MFRRVFTRSPISPFSKNVAQHITSGQTVQLYKVQILQPWRKNVRRAAVGLFTAFLCYHVYTYAAFLPLTKFEVSGEIGPQEEDEIEPFFIPFPWTTKQIKPLPYAGAEEEWQAFVQYGKNSKLRAEQLQKLQESIVWWCQTQPNLKKWGKEYRVVKSNLKHAYPVYPPPEFERSGIELTVDGLKWTTRKVEHRIVALTDRFGYPVEMFYGWKAFAQELVMQNVRKVGKHLGYDSADISPLSTIPKPEMAKTLEQLEERQTPGGGATSSSNAADSAASSGSFSTAGSDIGKRPALPRQSETVEMTSTDEAIDEANKPRSARDLIPFPDYFSKEAKGPWKAFIHGYATHKRPFHVLPPRGSLQIWGTVELESDEVLVDVAVSVFYDPKTKKFHGESARVVAKHLRLKKVSPLR